MGLPNTPTGGPHSQEAQSLQRGGSSSGGIGVVRVAGSSPGGWLLRLRLRLLLDVGWGQASSTDEAQPGCGPALLLWRGKHT